MIVKGKNIIIILVSVFCLLYFTKYAFCLSETNRQLIDNYKVKLEAEPDSVSLHFELGEVYLSEGSFMEGLKEMERVVAIDPNHLKAHVNLAMAYINLNRYNLAIYELKIAREIYDKDTTVLSKRLYIKRILAPLAQLYEQTKDIEKAKIIWRQIVEMADKGEVKIAEDSWVREHLRQLGN